MDIDPRRLPILLAVEREGGIVSAADVLFISPSAVSQQIQKLENEVGLELIERTPSGAILTPAGRVLVQTAERIENELQETAQILLPLAGQVTGVVTIGAFQSVLRTVLLPFVDHLKAALPGVEIHLAETEELPGMAALRSGRYDLLVIERDSEPGPPVRGYTDEPFIDEPWVLVTPESAPHVGSERDLDMIEWLRVAPGSIGAHVMDRVASNLSHPKWVPFSYTNYEAAHSMIRAGIGSTIEPAMGVEGISTDGMRVTPLPGLGVRRILLRHKNAGWKDQLPARQVAEQLFRWVALTRGTQPVLD
ncbi:LysR family transcriptional regulator [Schaalia vaccimaxillae]|uniref:LysR family transcriptional regulator n=1 Tax=Schaalia vaccimaxillae TaxID=183916 RepID=UPI0003B582CF|nr:LysR family transcriptional regulator [Schaalia vaccimaxillae]